MFTHKLNGTWKCPFNHSVLSPGTKYVLIGEHRGQLTRSAQSRLHLALSLMHRMASISASILNDEGGREKNGMYQLWGSSQGIQEGEECVNGGGGGGGGGRKQKRIQRGAGVILFIYLLDTDGHATCKCIYIYTHAHIHTCSHTHIHIRTYIHILMVTAGSCEFSARSEEVGLSFQIQSAHRKLCEWEWTQVSTDPTAQCAHC